MTEVGILPSDWEVEYLDNVAERKSGHTPDKKVESYWNGNIPWISLKDLSRLNKRFVSETTDYTTSEGIKNSSAVLLPMGTIVISRDATVGKIGILSKEMATSQHFINYICSSRLNNIYLYYYLLFKNHIFERIATGSTIKTIGLGFFKKLKVALPPINEQQKIASILSTWDKAIELKEKLIEQKKEQKKGLMQKLLTGEVRLPGFEGEWREVKLGKIGKTYNGLSGKTAEDFGEGKPYIPYKTIFDDSKINLQKLDYVKINIGEKQNSAKKGDIFFTTSSETPHEVGMSSVLLDDVDEIYLNSFCFGYRLNDFSVLLPNFAQHYFRSDDFRKKIYALAQGSTRFNISKNEVMKIAIKIPDLKEQEGISKILSESDKEILLLANQVRRLKEQKQGLMQLLLTGKVRVKV